VEIRFPLGEKGRKELGVRREEREEMRRERRRRSQGGVKRTLKERFNTVVRLREVTGCQPPYTLPGALSEVLMIWKDKKE
jgi:hypothetical protein